MKLFSRAILVSLALLVSQCGTFDASYTDKNGTTYHGGIVQKNRTTSDAK